MKNKDEDLLFAGRIRDLARQAQMNDYLTHTGFLSLSEQSRAAMEVPGLGMPGAGRESSREGFRAVFYGGSGEADRKVLFFLPSYMDEKEFFRQEEEGNGVTACLEIRVRGARFSREIGHRDCLGALMHLGIERDQVGDILIDKDGALAYVYVLSSMAEHICRELRTVGKSSVELRAVPPSGCGVKPELKTQTGSIASVRIDSLVAMAFHLSRSAAQELVSREQVFADGRTVTSSSFVPGEGCRISVRGHGKFIYEGEEKTTRKGRIFVRISVFC